jgi:hypothetical protein
VEDEFHVLSECAEAAAALSALAAALLAARQVVTDDSAAWLLDHRVPATDRILFLLDPAHARHIPAAKDGEPPPTLSPCIAYVHEVLAALRSAPRT